MPTPRIKPPFLSEEERLYAIGYHKGYAEALDMRYTKRCAEIYAEKYAEGYVESSSKIVIKPLMESYAGLYAAQYEKGFYKVLGSLMEEGKLTYEEIAKVTNMTFAEFQAHRAKLKKKAASM